jgi:hypothetical protein
LPILYSRIENFFTVVAQTVQYLQSVWPNELAELHVDVSSNPPRESGARHIERWRVDRRANRITLYRIPIQRMSKLHRDDDLHRQMAIESAVFHAVAEYMDKKPWELGGDHLH